MKRILTMLLSTLVVSAAAFGQNVYDFTVKDKDGKDVSLAEFKGKVLLIVNTATECGFTPQYEALQELYDELKDEGLLVLDFPCNQFGAQAPGTIEEIDKVCTGKYKTTFPRFAKIDVNGENADPLFTFLKSKQPFKTFGSSAIGKRMAAMLSQMDPDYASSPDIKWNFTKFLVDTKGNVVARFEPTADMDSVMDYIEDFVQGY